MSGQGLRGLTGIAAIWWEQLPRRLSRLHPTAGALAADGRYLRARPAAAALLPPLMAAAGALMAVVARFQWFLTEGQRSAELPSLYSQSLLFLMLTAAAGALSAQLGGWLWLSYSAVGFLLHLPDPLLGLNRVHAYGALALPALLLADRSQRLHASLAESLPPDWLQRAPGAAWRALSAGVLAWAWAVALPALVQPTWSWLGPSGFALAAAVQPALRGALLIGLAGAAGAYLRARLEPEPAAPLAGPPPAWRRWLPPGTWQAALGRGLVTTVLLAGLVRAIPGALALLAITTLFYAARDGLIRPPLPVALRARYQALPGHLRLPALMAGALLLSWLLYFLSGLPSGVMLVELALLLTALLLHTWLSEPEGGEPA
ncbi:MAG: hypothetical protein ACOY94_04025 [Bacillota bacterium]